MQGDVRVSRYVRASPEATFAAVMDWTGQSRWIPLTATRVLDPTPGVGQRVVARTGLGPVAFDDPMTVTWWDPPRRCEVIKTGRVVRGTGAFIVEEAPGGSTFIWEDRVIVPGGPLAPLIWPLGRLVARASLAWAQRRLARLVESG